jgi:LPXTG-site transpeptidase (sortase) family protein
VQGRLVTGARRNLRWAPVALAPVALALAAVSWNAGPPPASATAIHDAPFTIAPMPVEAPTAPALPLSASPDVQVANPARVIVSRLGISASMQPLHLGSAGELVPPAYGSAGWYSAGPEPGEIGRAVIAGHVDSKKGPDVFANLRNARPGDRVVVRLVDGSEKDFVVDDVGLYKKSAFPTDEVYGQSADRELRLITCGGTYDKSHGGYQSNVVVFAHEVS